ncbi:hypothetical protein F5B22DRAFT_646726 [Xylaria bambusicola]|uniref:uncharacterized protein n=1 Tax=Xylaria bambusicola TaxID=326684 RepID=UPI002007D5DF|nr:uncharacterized protein F5B22DRAFT_646726 [Xylaria bambusicola]KAI0515452.1 hypothetical protein F5B22DRAFT_646726 [Xylaria bambusicola]
MFPGQTHPPGFADTEIELPLREHGQIAGTISRSCSTIAASARHQNLTVDLNEDAAFPTDDMSSACNTGRDNPCLSPRIGARTHGRAFEVNKVEDIEGKRLKSKFQRFDSFLTDTWAPEVLWCVMAIAFLVGMSAFLAAHQGIPQPQWRYGISINTVISLLVGAIVGALASVLSACVGQTKWQWFASPRVLSDIETFDGATRNFWGKLQLLTHGRGREHHLANYGCLIALGTLAIGPFSQQIVQYYNCFSVSPYHLAWLPRSNNYTAGARVYPGHSQLDPEMASAIYTGILDPPKTDAGAVKSFSCDSGNCTLPQFSTLGMCHSCHEILELIHVNETFPGYWLDNWVENPSWNWWREDARVGWTNESWTTHYTYTPYTMLSSRKTLGFDPSISDAPFDDLITLDFLTLNVNAACDAAIGEMETCPKHPWAVRCSLYPCIKTFTAKITNSKLSENLTSSIPMKKSNVSAIEVTTSENLTWSYAVNTTLRHGQNVDCKPSSSPTTINTVSITSNGTTPISSDEAVTWYPEDCVYSMGYPAALAINQFLSVLFDVNSLESRNGSVYDLFGNYWLKTFYNNGMANISTANTYFESLAAAITATMRESGQSAVLADAIGLVLQSETCIRIRWPWLTLPIFFVLATVGFLISTIMSSAWRGAWKSSFLAAVSFGVHNAALELLQPLDSKSLQSVMVETAKHMRVQLYVDRQTTPVNSVLSVEASQNSIMTQLHS